MCPKNNKNPKLPRSIGSKWLKSKEKVLMFSKFFVALIIFQIKPTCFKRNLLKRQRQSGFHFLIFILMMKERCSFLCFENLLPKFLELKEIWFLQHRAKRNMVSVPYYTVFGFLLYSSWRVLRSYVGVLLSCKFIYFIS